MLSRFRQWLSAQRAGRAALLYLIVPAVAVSAVALGYYGDQYAGRLAGLIERSILDAHRAIVDEKIERIEQLIIDTDRTLFYLADLEKPKEFTAEFRARWRDIVRLTPTVDSVVVLDSQRRIVQRFHKEPGASSDRFEALFAAKILPDLDLASLPLNHHRHLHKEYAGDYYLISYIAKRLSPGGSLPRADGPGGSGTAQPVQPGERYYVAIKANLGYIRRDIFREVFAGLDQIGQFAVVDEWGRTVFGRQPERPAPAGLAGRVRRASMRYERKFPTTLYQWRLVMTPTGATRLVAESQKKRLGSALLFSLTVLVIFVGLGILVYAVRKEQRLGALKSDFIANVSHELKTPLSLIRMFGELLLMGRVKGADQAREYYAIITRESERLTRLIDTVLDFARLEQGKTGYDFREGDLGQVVERSLELYRHRLEREEVELTVELEPALPTTLFDEAAMTLVLLNLVDNAIKYGVDAEGRGQVTVSLGRRAANGGTGGEVLELAVSDRGPGIRPEDRRRIWERFYRAPASDGRRPRGSGIGLTLVKHIAEAHGGSAVVETAPGGGARFVVTVPVRRAPGEAVTTDAGGMAGAPSPAARPGEA